MGANTHAGGGPGGPPKTSAGITTWLAGKFLRCMKCSRYELCTHRDDPFHHEQVVVDANTILARINQLKRLNLHGCHVWILPADNSAIAMVDIDHRPIAIEEMVNTGYQPVVVANTSPGHYQAWVRFSLEPVVEEIRVEVASYLTQKFGGDLASVTRHRYGRLPGFTNRKEGYDKPTGQFPYVKIGSTRPGRCDRAADLLKIGTEAVASHTTGKLYSGFSAGPQGPPRVSIGSTMARRGTQVPDIEALIQQFREACSARLARYSPVDWSAMEDGELQKLAVKYPGLTLEDLEAVLSGGSLRVARGHRLKGSDYIRRTAAHALAEATDKWLERREK